VKDQSINQNTLYSAVCRERIRGADYSV